MGNDNECRVSWFPAAVAARIAPPGRFTFPFYYEPHPLAEIAAAELQQYLETQTDLDHNFGLDGDCKATAIGKMFGVLVIRDPDGRIGYLSAYSGKLAGSNEHPRFVPPVFDMLAADSFFHPGIAAIDAINAQVAALSADSSYLQLGASLERYSETAAQELSALKQELKANKEARRATRHQEQGRLGEQAYALLEATLVRQSLHDKHRLKLLADKWQSLLHDTREKLAAVGHRIEALKKERSERSAALQEQLFEQYVFLNKDGKGKSLRDIFRETAFGRPPSAAGECATPKLLQFAFRNGYTPLAMAEFWWGASPKSEIRKHRQYYPACTGKCKPILAHMLAGMPLDDNPFLQPAPGSGTLDIVYEDDSLLVVNKPSGLRSVPGVDIADSVYSRLALLLGTAPLIVHRLDMDTSGLLVVARTPTAHRHLQQQFLRRTVGKRYTALLSKIIDQDEGCISLPLRADPYNRPRQLVCPERGKKSITRWQVVARTGGTTRVHFWPLTGRTHQLRMHAAHELGLHAPIVGDDLYGTPDGRLRLHAAHLDFVHPTTRERLSFDVAEAF